MDSVPNILLVDDSMIVRERLKLILEETIPGVNLYEARNWAEGKDLFERLRPDIVMLDIHLPDGNGIDLLALIKSASPSVLVIMITNYAYAQYGHECKRLGADYFLDKSMEYDLIRKIFKTKFIRQAV